MRVTEDEGFVPYQQRVGYLLNNVPETIMRRLHRTAAKEKTSMTNIVGEILSERYRVDFIPSARPQLLSSSPTRNLSLRLPALMMQAARREADDRAVTIRTVLLDALAEALRLKPPPPTSVDPAKRPGRPRTERI